MNLWRDNGVANTTVKPPEGLMTWMYVSAMHGNQAYEFISLQFSFLPLICIRKTQKRNQLKKKWVKWGKWKFEFFFYKASKNSVNHPFIQFKGDRRIFARVLAPWATYILLRKLADIVESIFTDLPTNFDKEYIPGAFPF